MACDLGDYDEVLLLAWPGGQQAISEEESEGSSSGADSDAG